MTNKNFLLLIAIFAIISYSNGQTSLDVYNKIYKSADSLKKIGKISVIDTTLLYKEVATLDKKPPIEFFETANKYIKSYKFNEASFVFYLGLMRYTYYVTANPKSPTTDYNSVNSIRINVGQPVNMYLQTDVDNFLFILKQVVFYYKKYDYNFFPKKGHLDIYSEQAASYEKMIDEVEKEKVKYRGVWESDRKVMEANIAEATEIQKELNAKK